MTNDMPNLEDADTETHVQNVTKHAPVTNLKRNEPTNHSANHAALNIIWDFTHTHEF